MRKRINTRTYDTTTAKLVASWSSNDPRSDFSWYEEDLYLKRNGEYFLDGWGNAASKYAAPYPGGGWQEGERIVPLGRNEALEWAETHLDGAEVDAIFGPTDEDNETESFTLDAATLAQLDYVTGGSAGGRGAGIERLIHRAYEETKEYERQDAELRDAEYGY